MILDRMIFAVDSHTAGEPTRVIVGGIPHIPGKTMSEKMFYFRDKLDFLRNTLMTEPRGHKDMYGALITAPCDDSADFGVIFMNSIGYEEMCGHGTIGVITVAIQIGISKPVEPVTTVIVDTPAGLVTGYASVEEGIVKSVTIRNVPSFFCESTTLNVPQIGAVAADVAYGGTFYAITSAKDIGIRIEPCNTGKLKRIGSIILKIANDQISVQHPEKKYINKILGVRICDEPVSPEANSRNVVVSESNVDRSPCGTGTAAHMATLYSKGQLKLNEEFVHESIIGTIFRGKLVEAISVGKYRAVIPEIAGSAYVTGVGTYIIDRDDPLKNGFLLR